jgi:hypothetical protein
VEETRNGVNHEESLDKLLGISTSKPSITQVGASTVQSRPETRNLARGEVSGASAGEEMTKLKGAPNKAKSDNALKKATQKMLVKQLPKEVHPGVAKEEVIKRKKKKKKKKKGGTKTMARTSAS